MSCVDTESTDRTWDEIGKRGIRRRPIARSEFQHGRTRNLGIQGWVRVLLHELDLVLDTARLQLVAT